MNHAQYEERIRFVDTVLRDKFHLTVSPGSGKPGTRY